jgi:peptide/nickel transport system permease protein
MVRFLLSRLGQLLLVVLAAITFNFFLIHLAPGGPAVMIVGRDASPEAYARAVEDLGLDRPLWVQYVNYLASLARGDLGMSFKFREPVLDLLLGRLPLTLLLAIPAYVLSVVIGVLLGVVAALHANTWLDKSLNTLSVVSFSLPAFWIAVMLILVFALRLDLFPVQGVTTVTESYTGLARAIDIGRHLFLPLVTIVLVSMGVYTRIMRTSMLEVLGQDYIRTAHAKGLRPWAVQVGHAMRNALLGVITLMGVRFGYLLAGVLVVEIVFAWPGMGRLVYDAMLGRDYPVILGYFLIVALMIGIGNLLADIAYTLADPRIELG